MESNINITDETITRVNTGDLAKFTDELVYFDKNVFIGKKRFNAPEMTAIQPDCILLIFNDKYDKLDCHINTSTYSIGKSQFAFILPNDVFRPICNEHNEEELTCLALSLTFLKDIVRLRKSLWKIRHYIHNEPILDFSFINKDRIPLYVELLARVFEDKKSYYVREKVQNIISTFFYELAEKVIETINKKHKEDIYYDTSELVFHRFYDLLLQDDGSHRDVAYYAKKMGYTPKYITLITKKVVGKPALKIINEHTMEQVKHHLLYSDMSIAEISYLLKFPNTSFFGKYVKNYLGISPQRYRRDRESFREQI